MRLTLCTSMVTVACFASFSLGLRLKNVLRYSNSLKAFRCLTSPSLYLLHPFQVQHSDSHAQYHNTILRGKDTDDEYDDDKASSVLWHQVCIVDKDKVQWPEIVRQEIKRKGINEGYVVVPSTLCHGSQRILPIVDGQLLQNLDLSEELNANTAEVVAICSVPERTIQTDLQVAREEALRRALAKLGIDSAMFALEEFDSTPVGKIYSAFISPRERGLVRLQAESLQRSAKRCAQQIDFALREQRAQNSVIRNTDFKPEERVRLTNPIVLVLDNIRSAYNVGSLFRTAETAGVAQIITCGITCRQTNPKLAKTALSATDYVPSRHFDNTLDAIEYLKQNNYTIVCMETTSRSVVYTDVCYPKPVALILGNEDLGVDIRVMERSDMIVQIPTFGIKNSLNVASAGPIVCFEVLRQWSVGTVS